jgi:hypothetical protein
MCFFRCTKEEMDIYKIVTLSGAKGVRTSDFVGQRRNGDCRRNRIRHLAHGGDATCARGCRFGLHRAFLLQPRLTEMDVAVDEARESYRLGHAV